LVPVDFRRPHGMQDPSLLRGDQRLELAPHLAEALDNLSFPRPNIPGSDVHGLNLQFAALSRRPAATPHHTGPLEHSRSVPNALCPAPSPLIHSPALIVDSGNKMWYGDIVSCGNNLHGRVCWNA